MVGMLLIPYTQTTDRHPVRLRSCVSELIMNRVKLTVRVLVLLFNEVLVSLRFCLASSVNCRCNLIIIVHKNLNS